MKKLLALVLALVLTMSLGYATLASTMGVNVSEGMDATLEYYSYPDVSFGPWFGFGYGVNDNLRLTAGYQLEDDNAAAFDLGARYEIIENLAATLTYVSVEDAETKTTLGLRGKYGISDALALTGKFEYAMTSPEVGDDATGTTLLAQAEYALADGFALNAGYYVTSETVGDADADGGNGYVFGAEYALDKICVYFDYDKNNDADDAFIILGVSYSF